MKRFFRRALLPMAAVAAVTVSTLPAEAYSFVPCNTSTTRVCYDEVGPTGLALHRYEVSSDDALATAAAYYDIYNIPFGSGGVQVPCITPIVNGAEVGTCARLGFELIDRTPLVPEAQVALVSAERRDPLVYVCEAELTVLVNNVGLNRFPILSACHNFMVE